MKKIELLAPAGSYESLLAAFHAGADAVYAGGALFGARAYADNFTEKQILQGIDYAHLHGKKLYLTVNTLLKTEELEQQLYDYIAPLYAHGLDGVIVQDVGVLSFLKSAFLLLPIHGSTQMTVTGIDSALFLKEQGVERIVPARELSIKELKEIKEACHLELEVFIHGALCYCYSGQCFFSSLLGGRSGNRGRCAQPCRLPYTINGNTAHYLSPKDLCGLRQIPKLYDAGVDSFKIEGRMKNAAYTAGVVSVYRKYLDMFYDNPKTYKVAEEDIDLLMDVYNRGGMTEGYFQKHNSGEMISPHRPNHFGVYVGSLQKAGNKPAFVKLQKSISKGDVLELRDKKQKVLHDMVSSNDFQTGESFPIYSRIPCVNLSLYRTKNKKLTEQMEGLANSPLYKELYGSVFLTAGKKACLILTDDVTTVSLEGANVQQARKQPLSKESVSNQLSKTGGTGFQIKDMQCHIDGEVFLPKQELNALRRMGLEAFEREVLTAFRRNDCYKNELSYKLNRKDTALKITNGWNLTASVETMEQLTALLQVSEIARMDIDSSVCPLQDKTEEEQLRNLYLSVREKKKQVFHRFPAIFRERSRKQYEKWFPVLLQIVDGFVVRNLDSYAYVIRKLQEYHYKRPIVCDFTMYSFQNSSKEFWQQNPCMLTAPIELNNKELYKNRGCYDELIVYGRYPMMVSAGCIDRTCQYLSTGQEGCTHGKNMLYLTDRYRKRFPVKQFCNECYNIIYNSQPLSLCENKIEIEKLQIPNLRLMFTTEDKAQVLNITKTFVDVFIKNKEGHLPPDTFTRGHFKRGVE